MAGSLQNIKENDALLCKLVSIPALRRGGSLRARERLEKTAGHNLGVEKTEWQKEGRKAEEEMMLTAEIHAGARKGRKLGGRKRRLKIEETRLTRADSKESQKKRWQS